MDDLKALSAAATPGRLSVANSTEPMPVPEGHPSSEWLDRAFTLTGPENQGSATVSANPAFAGWNTDGGCGGYGLSNEDARFIAALWNAYRDGRLVER